MFEIFGTLLASFTALGMVGMAVIGVSIAAILVSSFMEKGAYAFLGLIGLGFGMVYYAHANPLSFVMDHPLYVAAFVAGYLAVGVFWSLAKFRLYTGELKNKFSDFKQSFLSERQVSTIEALDPTQLDEFRTSAQRAMSRAARYGTYPVLPQQHKATILFWMAYWPVSVVAYLLNDPIKKLLNMLYRVFSGRFTRIAQEQAREYLADMGAAAK
jgi:hypothetical protein